jgi:hypothetical protein
MLHPCGLANYGFHSALPTVLRKRSLRRASLPRHKGRSKGLSLSRGAVARARTAGVAVSLDEAKAASLAVW